MSSTGKGMQTWGWGVSAEETKATTRGAGQGLSRPLGAEQGEAASFLDQRAPGSNSGIAHRKGPGGAAEGGS